MTVAIDIAREKWERAANELRAAIAIAYPMNCRVTCILGGHKITGTVQGHAPEWHTNPQMVWVLNEKTGRPRRVSAVSGAQKLTRID